jgi:hypothetical protein
VTASRRDAAIQRFSHDVRRLFGGRFFYALIFGLSKKRTGMPAPRPTKWIEITLLLLAILFFITALLLILKK